MAASEVSIINRALIRLERDTIASRAGSEQAAVVADAVFDEVRDELLRGHPWSFATRRIQLARSARTPVSGFDYQYPIPEGYLRTVIVSDSDAGYSGVPYKIESDVVDGTVILADSTQIFLTYIAQVTDVTKFPPDFREALSAALAREMAMAMTVSTGVYDRMVEWADKTLVRAKSVESIEDMPDQRPDGSWVTARRGRQYGSWV